MTKTRLGKVAIILLFAGFAFTSFAFLTYEIFANPSPSIVADDGR